MDEGKYYRVEDDVELIVEYEDGYRYVGVFKSASDAREFSKWVSVIRNTNSVQHWKANHDEQVKKKRRLTERLGAAIAELREVRAERDSLSDRLAIAHDSRRTIASALGLDSDSPFWRIIHAIRLESPATAATEEEQIKRVQAAVDAAAKTIAGRLDKPFHRPECQCESCESWCKANPVSMSITDAADILRRHNAWRRGGDGDMEDPTLVGIAIDTVVRAAESNVVVPFDVPSEISKLREDNARLRALHSEYRADINRLQEQLEKVRDVVAP